MNDELRNEKIKSVFDFSGRYFNLYINETLFYDYRNLTESSNELMNLFLNYPQVIELDLSNNLLSKLPLEISFLTNLTKLDIRNNAFTNVINHFILI